MNLSVIKEIRKMKKLSQQELGDKLNVSGAYIQQIENNKKNPSIKTLNKISDALEVDLDILLNGLSFEIYTKDDVFNLYNKLNTKTALSKFLGFSDDYDPEFISFKKGEGNLKLYIKLGKYLNLTDNQIYTLILSNTIIALISNCDSKVSDVSDDDIKFIINNQILKKQSINSLINEGLSDDNKILLKNYFSSRRLFIVKTLKDKYELKENFFEDNDNNNDLKSDTTNQINEINDFLRKLNKLENHKTFSDSVKKISLLSPILEYLGVNIKDSYSDKVGNVYITVYIRDKDFYHNFDLEDFIDFIDKIFWGIERGVDYLKHLYD